MQGNQPQTALRRAARPRRRRSYLTLILVIFAMFLLFAGIVAGGAVWLYSRDAVTPGLQSLGVELGGRSRDGAEAALRQYWSAQAVTVDLGGMQQTVRPDDLGVTLDVTSTVQLAFDAGRSSSAIEQMARERRLALPDTLIDPVWSFDAGRADRTLQAMARQVYMPPVDAGVKISGDRAQATASMPGRALDVAASGARLNLDPWGTVQAGRFRPVILPVSPQITDTAAVAVQINHVLTAPISIHLYDAVKDEKRDWQVPISIIAGWVSVTPGENGHGVTWTLERTRAEDYLAAQAASLGTDRYVDMSKALPAILDAAKAPGGKVSLRIFHKEGEYTIKSGETLSAVADKVGVPYPWIQKANPGLGDSIRPGQVVKIPSPDALIPLTPIENKRIVVSISKQRVLVYENGAVKWDWSGSTGMSFSPTAPGIFQIQTHEQNAYAGNWDLWMPWFLGVYRPVPDVDFMNGFHGFPSRAGSQILWVNDLGHPITYGCILLSTENAKALYDWAQAGVVVEIRA